MHYRIIQHFLLFSVFSFAAIASATTEKAATVTLVSIKPLAMIYAVLQPETAAAVQILIPANRNLHDYALSVKDLKRLQAADTLFWLGAESEPFIAKVQPRLSHNKQWVALSESSSHAWLDVNQLPALINKMAYTLIALHPQQAEQIKNRADQFLQTVAARQLYWQQQLQPHANTNFLLGHDAFVVFAKNIGLEHAVLYRSGHDHGHAPGGMHELLAIQKKLSNGEIRCAMQEPEVDFSDLAKRYPSMQLAYVEPMARNITINADAYLHFFDNTAQAFQQCLENTEH